MCFAYRFLSIASNGFRLFLFCFVLRKHNLGFSDTDEVNTESVHLPH